jgi:hypothetical protein
MRRIEDAGTRQEGTIDSAVAARMTEDRTISLLRGLMFARIRLLAALPVLAVMLAAPGETAAQSYAEGYQAFNAGNYETARQIWQDLADRGDTLAMIGLGTLYERGFGVRQNAERALQRSTFEA